MTEHIFINLCDQTLSNLLPLHLLLEEDGRIVSAGRTALKLIPKGARRLDQVFELTRPMQIQNPLPGVLRVVETGERIGLRVLGEARLNLRGHVVRLLDGRLLLNLGFGIGLPEAVRRLDLTDSDFAPPELAMELLFLYEANRGVMGELSLFTSSLEAAREAAEVEAHTDALTGLRNRRGFMLALDSALRAIGTGGDSRIDTGFALAHLDLDRFKEVNDQYGHAAGDEVLRQVARVLREVIRTNDCAARIGGDEFVLLLRGISDAELLERLSQRIIDGVERPVIIPEGQCEVSVSIGIVTSHRYQIPNAQQMLAEADVALYRSKHAGRARATILATSED